MASIDEMDHDNWPVTEDALLDETHGVSGFAGIKLRAITRATSDLYGETTAPDETEIPEIAKQWIADKTTVRLISVGIDFYTSKRRLSDSTDNMTIRYYDRERQLAALRDELEADLAKNLEAALAVIDSDDSVEDAKSVPAVSTAGLIVRPTANAYDRGPLPLG